MNRLIAAAGAGLAVLGLSMGSGAAASGGDQCNPVVGHLEETQVDGDRFQARGRLTGDIATIVSGAFDLETGKFSDLLTIVGGTGEWSDATGQIHLFGTFDFESGTGRSDYRGEVCTK